MKIVVHEKLHIVPVYDPHRFVEWWHHDTQPLSASMTGPLWGEFASNLYISSILHWNGNVFILMKFSSLAALEVVKMTTSSAASD